MIKRQVINRTLYLSSGFVILALTGVFGSFAELSVIQDTLQMSTTFLLMIVLGTGFYMASLVHEDGPVSMLGNAAVGGGIVTLVLGILTALLYVFVPGEGVDGVQVREWVTFTFPNLSTEMYRVLLFGRELGLGLVLLVGAGLVLGLVAGGLFLLPNALRGNLLSSVAFAVVLGLMQSQLLRIVPLTDAIVLVLAIVPGFLFSLVVPGASLVVRSVAGVVAGIAVGLIAAAMVNGGLIMPDQISIVLALDSLFIWMIVIGGLLGLFGATAAVSSPTISAGTIYFMVALLTVGVMSWQGGMTLVAFVITFFLLTFLSFIMPLVRGRTVSQGEQLSSAQRGLSRQVFIVLALTLALVAPTFLGRSLTFALALVGMYIIMGIGLNIVVGFAGLLDLGHVGFFAIGAYTIGLLTSPTILTCGGIPASEILVRDVAQVREMQELDLAQTSGDALFIEDPETDLLAPVNCNILNFWVALPIAVFAAGAAGIILGVPVLRLRGDYLAIVTLGLSEIISIIIGASTFRDVFGSAQGISPIPSPVIDMSFINAAWRFEFFSAQIYYLIVPGILIAIFISQRLANSRVGRAWRSMRADEDVAEAMGIDLVRAKLSAFGISAAFAGLGGAFFGAGLQGAFPNSFTLLVSINVLSMIIIGGLGSIPGVVVGALVLVGLPEILRELDDYRLLVFGMLLVVMMLLKPEGLIPPPVRKLTDRAKGGGASVEPAVGD